ncbi:sugar transferase [Gallibacterium sp. ZY190522]
MAAILLILLSPLFLYIAYKIHKDSPGGVFFKQTRVTQYGREFKIYKFRTMVANAEALGSQVTTDNDKRITAMGEKLRKTRLDEIPQLINILKGEMSFVGTRPEVPKYVDAYTDEMMATLLLPAGVTSEASIEYKDEDRLLSNAENADKEYIEKVLPEKMKWNLESIRNYSFSRDLVTMIKTVLAVIK